MDCIVFWTKNPAPLFSKLNQLETLGYSFCFLFTLNNYGTMLEPYVPPLQERIDPFRRLADHIGRNRLVWRFDPVIFTSEMTIERHTECLGRLVDELGPYCCKSVVSFVDFYPRCKARLKQLGAYDPTDEVKQKILKCFAVSAGRYGIPVEVCAENLDLIGLGVRPGSCIDRNWLSQICQRDLKLRRAVNQRPGVQLCLKCGYWRLRQLPSWLHLLLCELTQLPHLEIESFFLLSTTIPQLCH